MHRFLRRTASTAVWVGYLASSEISTAQPGEGVLGEPAPAAGRGWWPDSTSLRVGRGGAYGKQGLEISTMWTLTRSARGSAALANDWSSWRPPVGVGVRGGLGLLFGSGQRPTQWLWAAGVLMRVGATHRLIVDGGYEAVDVRDFALHGVSISSVGAYGWAARAGYELAHHSGVHFRILLGPTWNPRAGRVDGLGGSSLALGYQWGWGERWAR